MTRASAEEPTSSATVRATAAVFLVAVLVHVLVWWQYTEDPYATTYISDALSYDRWAARIAASGLAGEPVFHQSPLFALLLAGIHALAPDVARGTWAIGLQVLLACAALAALVPLGRIWFGSATVGTIGAGLALLHGPFVFYALKLLPVPLALAAQTLGLLALGQARRDRRLLPAALAGACWGLACLARSELLLFVPIPPALLAWRAASPAGRRWGAAAAWIAGLLLAIAPATAHNARQGDLVLVASAAGENLFVGNQRGANGGYTPLAPGAGDIFAQRFAAQQIAERERGGPLRPSQVSAFWTGRALVEIVESPTAWVGLELRKLGRVLHPGDPTDIYSFALEREAFLGALRPLALTPWVLLLLGAVGVALALGGRAPGAWPVAALALTHLLVLLAFFVDTRLRLPLLFTLCPFGGLAILDAARRWRAGRRGGPALLAALTLIALVVGTTTTRPAARDRVRLASVLSLQERLDDALAALEPELSLPEPDPSALDQAGWVLQKRGDFAQAREHYVAALADRRLAPGRATQTRTRLARVLERLERFDEAAEQHELAAASPQADAGTFYERALFRLRGNDREGAVEDLRRASLLDPRWPAPRAALKELGADRP